jgi:hypothetical protein
MKILDIICMYQVYLIKEAGDQGERRNSITRYIIR